MKDSKGKNLKKNRDYTVAYSRGCRNVGQYTVTIRFKNNYSGKIIEKYWVMPKGTSVSKVSAKTKGFVVKWKRQYRQISGYQVQYASNSKFKKAKKKYYVRVRAYRNVEINGKTERLYSEWSKVKKVTTKK